MTFVYIEFDLYNDLIIVIIMNNNTLQLYRQENVQTQEWNEKDNNNNKIFKMMKMWIKTKWVMSLSWDESAVGRSHSDPNCCTHTHVNTKSVWPLTSGQEEEDRRCTWGYHDDTSPQTVFCQSVTINVWRKHWLMFNEHRSVVLMLNRLSVIPAV